MPKPRPVFDRVMDKVVKTDDHWKWTGSALPSNSKKPGKHLYGVIKGDHPSLGGDGGARQVHRVVWEALVGPIPDGATIDHTCDLTTCVRPDHLQVVTRGENTALRWKRKPPPLLCPKGHDNWRYYMRKDKGPFRQCRTCQTDHSRLRKAS